jgi:hypothetical protein
MMLKLCRTLRQTLRIQAEIITSTDLLRYVHRVKNEREEDFTLDQRQQLHFGTRNILEEEVFLSVMQAHTKRMKPFKIEDLESECDRLETTLDLNISEFSENDYLCPAAVALCASIPLDNRIYCKLCRFIVSENHFRYNHRSHQKPTTLDHTYTHKNGLFFYSPHGEVCGSPLTALIMSVHAGVQWRCNLCPHFHPMSLSESYKHLGMHMRPYQIETFISSRLLKNVAHRFSPLVLEEMETTIVKLQHYISEQPYPSIEVAREFTLFESTFFVAAEDFELNNEIINLLGTFRRDYPDTIEARFQEIIREHVGRRVPNASLSDPHHPRLYEEITGEPPNEITIPQDTDKLIVLSESTLFISDVDEICGFTAHGSCFYLPIMNDHGLLGSTVIADSASNVLLSFILKYPSKIFLIEINPFSGDYAHVSHHNIIRQIAVIDKIRNTCAPRARVIVAAGFPNPQVLRTKKEYYVRQEQSRAEAYVAIECFRRNIPFLPLVPRVFPTFPDYRETTFTVLPKPGDHSHITPNAARELGKILKSLLKDFWEVLELSGTI